MEELKQTGEEYDEYLDVGQVAFLLERQRQVVQDLIKFEKFPAIKVDMRFLIKLSDLKSYVEQEKNKYAPAKRYASLAEEEKADFWKQNKTVKSNIAKLPHGYLTLQMCAYLLTVTDRRVLQIFNKGELEGTQIFMTDKSHYKKTLIQEDSVFSYAEKKLAKWDKVQAYIDTEDKYQYWKNAKFLQAPYYYK